jgi:hypothetical protein
VAFPFSDKNKHMMMLSAYMDETGHSSDERQKFVGIAGLLAPAANWEIFEGKWKAALAQPHFNIPHFHMTDFAARKRGYKGWSEEKRQKVFGKLMNVIESIYPLPFGSIVPLDDFRRMTKEHQTLLTDPYFICFQSAVAACTTFLEHRKLSDEEKVALIFSDQIEFRHRALQLYEKIEEIEPDSLRTASPVFRDMRELVPLQAADIIAYEMYKEVERRLYRPTQKPRFGFERIERMTLRANFTRPLFRFFTKYDFDGIIRQFEQNKRLKEYLEKRIKEAS